MLVSKLEELGHHQADHAPLLQEIALLTACLVEEVEVESIFESLPQSVGFPNTDLAVNAGLTSLARNLRKYWRKYRHARRPYKGLASLGFFRDVLKAKYPGCERVLVGSWMKGRVDSLWIKRYVREVSLYVCMGFLALCVWMYAVYGCVC